MQRILIPARTLLRNREFTVVLVANVVLGLVSSLVARGGGVQAAWF